MWVAKLHTDQTVGSSVMNARVVTVWGNLDLLHFFLHCSGVGVAGHSKFRAFYIGHVFLNLGSNFSFNLHVGTPPVLRYLLIMVSRTSRVGCLVSLLGSSAVILTPYEIEVAKGILAAVKPSILFPLCPKSKRRAPKFTREFPNARFSNRQVPKRKTSTYFARIAKRLRT